MEKNLTTISINSLFSPYNGTMWIVPTLLLLFLFFTYLYNFRLIFYHEKAEKLAPHEEDCFHPEARSIIRKHESSDKAILFIHGFAATPQMYSWATGYLYEKGYDCFAPLIPTHGTNWEEFSASNFSSWFEYINDYYLGLRKAYRTLHVVGISMGGAMTLELAERYSGTDLQMEAIATISAPVVYNSFLRDQVITFKSGYFGRYMADLCPAIKPSLQTSRPGHNDGDEHTIGYGGVYPKQGVSLVYNLHKIRRDLPMVTVPLFACHCTSDKTVPFGNLAIIAKETSSPCKKIEKLEIGNEFVHSHHVLLQYNSSRERVMAWLYPFLEEHNVR